jgi:hypothetical protein
MLNAVGNDNITPLLDIVYVHDCPGRLEGRLCRMDSGQIPHVHSSRIVTDVTCIYLLCTYAFIYFHSFSLPSYFGTPVYLVCPIQHVDEMEPISIVAAMASLFTLLQGTKKVLNWCCSIREAPDYLMELRDYLVRFEIVIEYFKNAVEDPLVRAVIPEGSASCVIERAEDTLSRLKEVLLGSRQDSDSIDASRLRAIFKLSKCQEYQEKLNQYCRDISQLLSIAAEIQKWVSQI